MAEFTLELLHVADQEAAAAAIQDAPRLSAVLNALKAQDLGNDGIEDNTLVLSSGDAFIPGLFFNASEPVFGSRGIADIQIQNELGFQAIAFGNHEFDFGTAVLAGLLDGSAPGDILGGDFAGAAFPYLSTNLNVASDASLAPLGVEGGQAPAPNTVTSSVVIEVNGENIGVVGATTPTLGSISSPGTVGILPSPFDANPTPEQLDALAAEIQLEVDALLAADPTLNKVVLLAHMQQISIELGLAERLTNVDIIVAGGSNTRLFDSNDRLRAGDSNQGEYPQFVTNAGGTQTAVVNTDGSYKYVGRLVLDFDAAGNIIPESYDAAISGAYATDDAGVAALDAAGLVDPEIQQIVDAIEAQILSTEANVFGTADVFLNGNRSGADTPDDPDGVRTQETNLGNLTADANLADAQTLDPTVVVSLKNGGGIRASIGQTIVPAGGTEFVRTPNEAIVDGEGNVVKPEGGISQNDIETTLAFNNGLTLLTLTKAELVALLEHGVSALPEVAGAFPQIAGVKFSYDPDLAAGDRIQSAAIFDEADNLVAELVRGGELVGDANETFRIVTLNFLAASRFDEATGAFIGGGDGYPFPNLNTDPALGEVGDPAVIARVNAVEIVQAGVQTGDATFADDGSEQDALAEYLLDNFVDTPFDQADTGPALDERIQNLNFREDTVFGDRTGGPVTPPVEEPDFSGGFDGPFTKIGSLALADGAEINAYDPESQKLFVVSGEPTLQVVDLSDPTNPTALQLIDLSAFGAGINSVAVKNGMLAVAVQGEEVTDDGTVVFLDVDGNVLNSVTVGALPDMVTFTPDGTKVLSANEGEPNDDYSIDPEGSVSIIDLSNGVDNAVETRVEFTQFNDQAEVLKAAGVKLFGLNATVAKDLEPEYIAVSPDGTKAWVTLQENNAVAVIDIASGAVDGIVPLGFKDYSTGPKLDASNRDGGINLQNWPVFGVYQPDSIASYAVGGMTYYVTANEGDARIRPDGDLEDADGNVILEEGAVFNEEARIADIVLDPTAFPDAATLQLEENLGRLNITTALGDTDGDGDFDELYSYGGRSFSIWDQDGNLVFDSGDDIANITAQLTPELFNANDGDPGEFDQRSDDKGAEPEALTVGKIGDTTYAFIGLERAGGGVLVYDVTNPTAPIFVQYVRDDIDIAPEGLTFISSQASPNGNNLLVVANEESGTLAIYAADAVGEGSGDMVLDFEGLAAGTVVTDQFDGVMFSTSNPFGVMLFDTENVTGGDFDLATDDQGNVLIISEDGDAFDPDDNAGGGTLSLDFDGLVNVGSIGLLDIEESDGLITFYGADDSVITTVAIAALGNNSLQQLSLGVTEVSRMDIFLAGSGAITDIAYSLVDEMTVGASV
ncbi:choice-of-anchor I family protein [Nodosilinea sp. LEGE 07088]|uniref:choice-of-anchor I family protein n=1 Tax=Nodosilinea sp. LEGE 07088 TaxID=2777968 RepID=UPI001882005E|nr:choice-of-anchor I family protein [Nodosilinea sp. LEGE 07088]MBE9136574.1 choice-of-anchor I family protein [Nodosilinea sp. LEGE 07088]